ncbi:MAG: hypothetical protein JWP87_5473 [Labilithrix sp.]|nr:hypothetical protein [Labilithrix sp.]
MYACALLLLILGCGALGCAAARDKPPAMSDPEAAALSHASLDTLEREACPRLLARTFALAEPRGPVTTGRLWVRRCSARRSAQTLDLDVDVLGWQWSGEESWGFEVREYVYFSAAIKARLSAAIEAAGDRVSLRVWTEEPPAVVVREIGRVDARASNPASGLLGAASALVGQGPNTLATASLRARVRDLIADRAAAGIPIVIGEAPAVRTGAAPPPSALLDETERLHPGGALISGSYAPGVPTILRWSVEGTTTALARPVCVDEALELVDAVVAERPRTSAKTPHDVVVLAGRGEAALPALSCRWVLVTGARDDAPVTVALVLLPRAGRALATSTRQWVRATLASYELSTVEEPGGRRDDSLAVAFSVGPDDAPRSFGRALPAAKSPSVDLVAPRFEIARGAPIVVRVMKQHPRAPSFWSPSPGYDETLFGRGELTLDSGARRQERSVSLVREGRAVGTVRLVFEAMDVE